MLTSLLLALTPNKLSDAYGITTDGTGTVYIADTSNNRIVKVTNNGNTVTLYNGNVASSSVLDPVFNFKAPKGIDYYQQTSGSSGTSSCSGGSPCNIIFVADTNNNRILRVNNDMTISMYGTTGTLSRPIGLSYDLKTSGGGCNAGNPCDQLMFIADTNNDRILQVSSTTTIHHHYYYYHSHHNYH